MNETTVVRLVAKTAPWLAPLPSAYFVARSSYAHLLANDWQYLAIPVAVIIGLVLELLGIASVHTILDLMRWNRQGRVARNDGWERAPVIWAWVAAVAYLVAVVLLLVVLEAYPPAAPFAPVLFPFVAVAGAILLGVIGQHDDRKARYSMGNDLKRKPDEQQDETDRPAKRRKSFVCPICGVRRSSQNALNGHMNAHRTETTE